MTEPVTEDPKEKQLKKPKSSLAKVSAFLVPIFVFLLLGAGVTGHWLNAQFNEVSVVSEDQILTIPSGTGVRKIAQSLEDENLIENAWIFKLGLKIIGLETGLKAGEFAIPAGSTAHDIARILHEGRSVLHRLTIPEGLTSIEIVNLINQEPKLDGILLEIPEEGTLLPETYKFNSGMAREKLIEQMQTALEDTLMGYWAQRDEDLPLSSPYEALILASIIEKETAVAHERGVVAGVFINRLRKGMRLQTDPTVIYGITKGQGPLGRALTRKDLRTPTEYNTYTIKGLPPGPIANPGRASIKAALNPQQTDYIYFVADGTGGHAFAKTLKDHNRNVAKWRKIQRSRN